MHSGAKKTIGVLSDFKTTFSTAAGKRVLLHLMKRTGFLNTCFVAGDPYTSAFNEGQRAVIIEILKKVNVDIKQLEYELTRDTEGEYDD